MRRICNSTAPRVGHDMRTCTRHLLWQRLSMGSSALPLPPIVGLALTSVSRLLHRLSASSTWSRLSSSIRSCRATNHRASFSMRPGPASVPSFPSAESSGGKKGGGWDSGASKSSCCSKLPAFSLATATGCLLTRDGEEKDPDYLSITVHELESAIEDLKHYVHWYYGESGPPSPPSQPASANREGDAKTVADDISCGWHLISKTPQYTIWSRPMKNGVNQFKVRARYEDIPAIVFLFVQMDLEGRRSWDSSTEVVELIPSPSAERGDDCTNSSGTQTPSELVYWRVNFPRPLAKRDYVFARNCIIDGERNVLVLVNKSTSDERRPPSSEYVRVTDYNSQMIIRPHHSFSQDGLDYVLTYHDDTKVKMPSYAYKRLIQNNLPMFMDRVHKESRTLYEQYKRALSESESSTGRLQTTDNRLQALHRLIQLAATPTGNAAHSATSTLDNDPRQEKPTADSLPSNRLTSAENSSIGKLPSLQESSQSHVKKTSNATSPQQLEWQRFIPIRKIRPPRYLPDLDALAQQIRSEGRPSRLKLKCYHSAPSYPASYPAYTESKNSEHRCQKQRHGETYPSYNDTKHCFPAATSDDR